MPDPLDKLARESALESIRINVMIGEKRWA